MTSATDDFNRADGALGTSTSGHVWALTGTWVVLSNQAKKSTGGAADQAVVTLAGPDMSVSAVVAALESFGGLVARRTDVSNFYLVQQGNALGMLQLYKRVAGTYTQLGSNTANGVLSAGGTLEIVTSGTSITAKVNGSTVIGPITDSALTTGNGAGIYSGVGSVFACRFDTFAGTELGGATLSAAATGATTTTGTADVTLTEAAAASGVTTTTGTAAVTLTEAATATGTTTTTGTAAVTLTLAAAAVGVTAHTGTAAATITSATTWAAAAVGATTVTGTAAATIVGPVVPTTAGRMTANATAGPSMTRRELVGATMTGGQV